MPNFKELAEARIKLKNNIDDLNSTLSGLKAELNELDLELVAHMKEQGQDSAKTQGYSFSVKQQDLFNAKDWAELCEWAENNRCAHIFQKRLTQAAVAEAVNIYGDAVPVETFTKVSMNVRKLPSST